MGQQFLQSVGHVEAVFAILVQLVGMFLILSSTVMFVKQEYLHRLDHVLQMNMLLCSSVFLLIDWVLVLPGTWPYEMFSLTFIFFGSANTFMAVGIAFERYMKMFGLSHPFSKRMWNLFEVAVAWLVSLLLVLYPVSERLMSVSKSKPSVQIIDIPEKMLNSSEESVDSVCFFRNSLLYRNSVTSGTFLLVAVILPFCLMAFLYVMIFKRVRKARLNVWLNRTVQLRSRQTQVIQCAGRKANVFQLTSAHANDQNNRRSRPLTYTRENSVLLKGMFSIAIVALCWLPFTAMWLYTSVEGFSFDHLTYVRYLMINSKLSVVLSVSHYICLNVKYRKRYIQTVFGQYTNLGRITDCLKSGYNQNEDHTSQIDSHVVTCPRSSVFVKTISSRTVLEPIQENQLNILEEKQRKTDGETKRSFKLRTFRMRSLSLPQNLMPSRIHPDKCGKQKRSDPCLCQQFP